MDSEANSNGYASESPMGEHVIKPLLDDIEKDMMEILDSVTIDDMCMRASSHAVPRDSKDRLDFTI